jgi:hypothetical protein
MSRSLFRLALASTLALAASVVAGGLVPAHAAGFPTIRAWVLSGAYQDSSNIGVQRARCVGSFGPRPDSLRKVARAISLRFLRDRRAEMRPDFGGYRIYRMVGTSRPDGGPDSTHAMLIRRFSRNVGSEPTWNFSNIDTVTAQYICGGEVVHDSILTFVDPDSNGNYVKECRRVDEQGRCLSKGDSVFVLRAPPGPHDGFQTWYSVTYERLNTTDYDYEDLFVPDTLDNYARCGVPGVPGSCPNLNNKLASVAGPATPTSGPTANLEGAHVVPNPYRGHEAWDPPGGHEIHFVGLPQQARIRIFTVAGDFVRELKHSDPINDYEIWDLKSGAGNLVASGIYIYRIESGSFNYQNRFIVIL